jgi:predicted nucleic acid-binding protein
MIDQTPVVIDSSVFVGLLNPLDHRHRQAVSLLQALQDNRCDLYYLDCVVAESLSTVMRRLSEQQRAHEIQPTFQRLSTLIPVERINWVYPEVPRLHQEILHLMQTSGGALNFNDTLIALACREQQVPAIASFDTDFDSIPWLHRLSNPTELSTTNH